MSSAFHFLWDINRDCQWISNARNVLRREGAYISWDINVRYLWDTRFLMIERLKLRVCTKPGSRILLLQSLVFGTQRPSSVILLRDKELVSHEIHMYLIHEIIWPAHEPLTVALPWNSIVHFIVKWLVLVRGFEVRWDSVRVLWAPHFDLAVPGRTVSVTSLQAL